MNMSTYQELPSIYRLKRSLTDVDQIANESVSYTHLTLPTTR